MGNQNHKCCKVVQPIDIDGVGDFFDGVWYIQNQTETAYLPVQSNSHVKACYQKRKQPTMFGYTIDIHNVAYRMDSGAGFLGAQLNPDNKGKAKYLVAPKFIPRYFAGDYWILAHEEGVFAVVCGGQPNVPDGCNGCTFKTDQTNNSGLWIFSREAFPEIRIIEKAKSIITDKGISLRGLNAVNHCM